MKNIINKISFSLFIAARLISTVYAMEHHKTQWNCKKKYIEDLIKLRQNDIRRTELKIELDNQNKTDLLEKNLAWFKKDLKNLISAREIFMDK